VSWVGSAEPASTKEDAFFDLSEILGDAPEAEAQTTESSQSIPSGRDEALRSVITVFNEQEGENRQEDVDFETHYNLGIAYSEMGLINEAIQEFELSAQSPSRFVDSHSMLSACYRKKGKDAEAISAIEGVIQDSRCGDSERKWLSYDLASLYEHTKRLDEAVKIYEKIYSDDPDFKDVKEKLASIRNTLGGQTKPDIAHEKEEDADSMIERFFENSISKDDDLEGEPKAGEKKKSKISYL